MKKRILVSTLLALTGCATSYTEPSLSADHPASLAAAEAPLSARSLTLDLEAAEPVSPAGTDNGKGHSGRDMGDKSSPAAGPAPDSGAHKHEAPPPAPKSEGTAAAFECPMHPAVTAQKPDQKCPKCGMKLVKKDGVKRP